MAASSTAARRRSNGSGLCDSGFMGDRGQRQLLCGARSDFHDGLARWVAPSQWRLDDEL